jgi:hypothetical protein
MNNKTAAIITLILGLIAAIYLGLSVAMASYLELSIYVVVGFTLWYLAIGWKITWKIAAFMLISRFTLHQGLLIEGTHLFAFMVGVFSIIAIFVHNMQATQSFLVKAAGLGKLQILIGLLLAYLVLHAFYNLAFPYRPDDYSAKNSAKAYFAVIAPFALLFWISLPLCGFKTWPGWSKSFAWIISFAVIANTVLLAWMTLNGYGAMDNLYAFTGAESGFFYIPYLNLSLNHHAMRTLAPESLFLLALWWMNPAWRRSAGTLTLVVVLVATGFGLLGSVLAGGRATLILSVFFVGVVVVKRRKVLAIAAALFATLLVFSGVNIFSEKINRDAPLYAARSLQFLMIDKGFAAQTIESSDNSRKAARDLALEEWKSNNRILFFGRSVYEYLGVDYHYIRRGQIGDAEAFAEMASRAGFTHNLISDLLIQFGVVGLLLYYVAALAVVAYFRRLEKLSISSGMPQACTDLAFYAWFTALVWLAYQSLAGGYMTAQLALVLGILKARYSQIESSFNKESTELKPWQIPD